MELNELSYSDYVQLCDLVNVTPMASDAWHNYVNEPEKLTDGDADGHDSKIDHISEVAKGLGFVMPPHFPSQSGISNVSRSIDAIRRDSSPVGRAVKIGTALRSLHRVYSEFRNTRITGGGGADTPNNSGYNRMFGFSNSHKPIELNYEPPIENNLYTYNTQTAEKQELVLSLNQWKWQLPDGNLFSQSTLSDVFFPNFRQFAQASVNFNIKAYELFTDANIEKWFETVMNAHAVYYFYANVIYYCSTYPSGNTGMFTLRDMFPTEDVLRLDDLRVRLRQIPIMKGMREAAFKFATPHYSGDDTNTTVCMNMPSTFTSIPDAADDRNVRTDSSTYVTESINDIFTLLDDLDFIKFTDMLARVYPDSVGHEVGPFNGTIVYDPEFLNHFKNFGSFAKNRPVGTTYETILPEITDSTDSTEFPLGSYTGGFNGAIEAMLPMYNVGTTGYTSLCKPLQTGFKTGSDATCYDTKWDFAYAADSSSPTSGYRNCFVPTNSIIRDANQLAAYWSPSIAREETYMVYGGNSQAIPSSHTVPLLGWNAYSQRQCYSAYFQYLLGINDKVQRGGGTSNIRGNSSRNRSTKRFKSKTKSTKESEE